MKYELMKLLTSGNYKLDRRLSNKIFIAIGVFCVLFVLAIGAIGYFGFKISGYVISNAPTTEDLEKITQQIDEQGNVLLTTNKVVSCLDVVQSLMGLDPWLERPVSENLADIYGSCFWSQQEEPVQKEEGGG
jgi:uncharacterized membrane protein